MDAATRDLLRQRAGAKCEYCHFPDQALDLPFHVEHIVASVHRVDDSLENLAWACPRCNLRKGPNLATIDPVSGPHTVLFNPRTMQWSEHFNLQEARISGRTSCGRGTAQLLDMNNEARLAHRQKLIDHAEFDVG